MHETGKWRNAAISPSTKKAGPGTPTQELWKEKFRKAQRYGKQVIDDPLQKEVYVEKAKNKNKRVFNLAMSDSCNAPEVTSLGIDSYKGNRGNAITVYATDDFKVASVTVFIYLPSGDLVEGGPASIFLEHQGSWLYTATIFNEFYKGSRIVAVAKDLPGNEGSLEALVS